MFETVRYVQNSFSITFPRRHDIRRTANDFEDFLQTHLEGHYKQPMVIPVPDEMDPEVPRLMFGSRHGFSQIAVPQIGLTLNATYSPDWQIEISKGRQYLLERVPILFALLGVLDDVEPCFSGLTSRVRLPANVDDDMILEHLHRYLSEPISTAPIHDVVVKVTTVHSDRFYSNMTIQNYRTWKVEETTPSLQCLSRRQVSERGIEITGDFNDRYCFNEQADYVSSPTLVNEIIDGSFAEMKRMIDNVQELTP